MHTEYVTVLDLTLILYRVSFWDTENGADDKDEINLVKPGFNSGWGQIMGFPPKRFNPENNLVNFDGKGHYNDPQFVWKQTVGPTFYNS